MTVVKSARGSKKMCSMLIGSILTENRDPAFFFMVVWALWNRRNNLRLGKTCGTLGQLLS